ncbi:hypothetical protein Lqui_1812 [Legionella quinlivanii]|uniref:MrfA-like Zn-binding domain-containing protein n=1 Tax=Legionella quinlivanii TaxID=45073 RepID=A0A0W0Y0D7_9GAMM|nr:DUF1998 domain-containing protein [Legionella quinlivanii]KTD50487.1 hypothetical protein Lqui_1812 [Legionella quinlivanii]SEF39236.1 hypothetical protein SAMN02746093_00011 [Legionella quinlivanii DSM 21216]STY12087.1 Domain of uncharacterised function (DUF1998) [Legionella quinlivanii]
MESTTCNSSNIFKGFSCSKSPTTGLWLGDSKKERIIASTLALALRNSIAEQLGISAVEMGFGYRLDKDLETGQGRSVCQIFDNVSGGAGFVLSGIDDIVSLLKNASEKLTCTADCDNICSFCLANQDSRVEIEELNRKVAKSWLEDNQLITHLHLPLSLSTIEGATYCSIGAQRFLRSIINKIDTHNESTVIQIALRGSPKDWDLINPSFREKILNWQLIDKINIHIGIYDVSYLSQDIKECLATLVKIGIKVFEINSQWDKYKVPLIAQISNSSSTYSLFCTSDLPSQPGENWLDANQSSIWVTSKLIPIILTKQIDTANWNIVDPGARVLKVSTELDGPVKNLKNRIEKLFSEMAPEFFQLIQDDNAINITYSDRYLKSPWSIILLSSFLQIFKNDKLSRLKILTVESNNLLQPNKIHHDWKANNELSEMIKIWLSNNFKLIPEIIIKSANRELQHSREISITWASGLKSKIILDQGMGYWQINMPHKYLLDFDFHQNHNEQLNDMINRLKVARMIGSNQWPTYITILSKM